MSHFLVIFGRDHRPPVIERIEDADRAVARLFELEQELAGDPASGVVLLVADGEETIKATHAHYFKTLGELLEQAETAVGA